MVKTLKDLLKDLWKLEPGISDLKYDTLTAAPRDTQEWSVQKKNAYHVSYCLNYKSNNLIET